MQTRLKIHILIVIKFYNKIKSEYVVAGNI